MGRSVDKKDLAESVAIRVAGPASALSNDDLLATTSYLRSMVDRGESSAKEDLTKFEQELTRRFGGTTTVAANLEDPPPPKRFLSALKQALLDRRH